MNKKPEEEVEEKPQPPPLLNTTYKLQLKSKPKKIFIQVQNKMFKDKA